MTLYFYVLQHIACTLSQESLHSHRPAEESPLNWQPWALVAVFVTTETLRCKEIGDSTAGETKESFLFKYVKCRLSVNWKATEIPLLVLNY